MRTLYESILDIENTISAGDEAAIRHWYVSPFYNTFGKVDVSYNLKRNILKSSQELFIFYQTTERNVCIYDVSTNKYIPWEEYDINHAKFNCPIKVSIGAIRHGFKYNMINHIHKDIGIVWEGGNDGGLDDLTPSMIEDFFGNTSLNYKNVAFNFCPSNKIVSMNIWNNVQLLTLYIHGVMQYPRISDDCNPLMYKNTTAKRLVIMNGSTLFDDYKTPTMQKKIDKWHEQMNHNIVSINYLDYIKDFLQNNKNTKLYIKLKVGFDKLELDGYNIKSTNISKAKLFND